MYSANDSSKTAKVTQSSYAVEATYTSNPLETGVEALAFARRRLREGISRKP